MKYAWLLTLFFIHIAPSLGAQIPPEQLTITAFSAASASPGVDAFNGTGLTGDTHDDVAANMWFSSGYNVIGKWIKIDLQGRHTLDHLRVWNYNQKNREWFGVQQADIFVALTDPGNNIHNKKRPFNPTGWTEVLADQLFTQSPGGPAISATDANIPLGGVEAAFLAIRIDSSYSSDRGRVGLSEVQIYVEDAGEPTFYVLEVINGTGNASYTAGSPANIYADRAQEGEEFDTWTGNAVFADANKPDTTITMPASDTTVTAHYKPIVATSVVLTVTRGSGDGTYQAGDVIGITAEPAVEGYEFDQWTTEDPSSLADAYAASTTITIPTSDVPVIVTADYKIINLPPTPEGTPIPSAQLTVTSFSSARTSPDANAFNGTGLFGGNTHDDAAANMWFSSGYRVVGKWIKVDLKGTYSLDHLKVWNYNRKGREYYGIQKADIYVALTDPGNNVDNKKRPFNSTGWTPVLTDQSFTRSPGGSAITATDTNIPLGGIQAAFLAIRINSSHSTNRGNVGLSEVQIYVNDETTEPTDYTLIVNGGSGGGTYPEGEEIIIKANDAPSGQVFDSWAGDTSALANPNDATTTVTMSASDLTVTATYKPVGLPLPPPPPTGIF